MLGFRHGPDDACVVAYDRATWKEAWRSEPLRSEGYERGHLTVTNDLVVFASKDVVMLDAANGKKRRTLGLEFPAHAVHVDPLDKSCRTAKSGLRRATT